MAFPQPRETRRRSPDVSCTSFLLESHCVFRWALEPNLARRKARQQRTPLITTDSGFSIHIVLPFKSSHHFQSLCPGLPLRRSARNTHLPEYTYLAWSPVESTARSVTDTSHFLIQDTPSQWEIEAGHPIFLKAELGACI